MVYHGPGLKSWEERPQPRIQEATDALVRITTTTVCGTDLSILRGGLPQVAEGRVLGHEGVGVVTAVGDDVSRFRIGDRVLISCMTSCGHCDACRRGLCRQCSRGGWILGHRIDGTQADFVRIPHADHSLYALPDGMDEESAVMLSDVMPSGFECVALKGLVAPGDLVAVVGAGEVGLAALLTAQFYAPAEVIVMDPDEERLAMARALGASRALCDRAGKAAAKVLALTRGLGVDVAIDASGAPGSLELCQSIIATGGRIANIAPQGRPVTLQMDRLWDRDITLSTRRVDLASIPVLLKVLRAGHVDARRAERHHLSLKETARAYDLFGASGEARPLKVILSGA